MKQPKYVPGGPDCPECADALDYAAGGHGSGFQHVHYTPVLPRRSRRYAGSVTQGFAVRVSAEGDGHRWYFSHSIETANAFSVAVRDMSGVCGLHCRKAAAETFYIEGRGDVHVLHISAEDANLRRTSDGLLQRWVDGMQHDYARPRPPVPNHVPHARARGTYVAGRTEEDSSGAVERRKPRRSGRGGAAPGWG